MVMVLLQPEDTDMGTTGSELRRADLTIYFTESKTIIVRLIIILCATEKESGTIKLQHYALLQFLYFFKIRGKKRELLFLFRYLILVICKTYVLATKCMQGRTRLEHRRSCGSIFL